MKVYAAINAVQAALAVSGISKDRTNTQGSGFKFRGVDDIYYAVAPLLAKRLCIVPRMLTRTCVERQSKSGGALFYVTVEAEFDFVSVEDWSTCTARTFGEAMDSGDKATNKAMSAAFKYALIQTFCIPTEGNPDADQQTHEVTSEEAKRRADWINERTLELESCESMIELREVYERSVRFARSQDDAEAVALLTMAKDAAKSLMEQLAEI